MSEKNREIDAEPSTVDDPNKAKAPDNIQAEARASMQESLEADEKIGKIFQEIIGGKTLIKRIAHNVKVAIDVRDLDDPHPNSKGTFEHTTHTTYEIYDSQTRKLLCTFTVGRESFTPFSLLNLYFAKPDTARFLAQPHIYEDYKDKEAKYRVTLALKRYDELTQHQKEALAYLIHFRSQDVGNTEGWEEQLKESHGTAWRDIVVPALDEQEQSFQTYLDQYKQLSNLSLNELYLLEYDIRIQVQKILNNNILKPELERALEKMKGDKDHRHEIAREVENTLWIGNSFAEMTQCHTAITMALPGIHHLLDEERTGKIRLLFCADEARPAYVINANGQSRLADNDPENPQFEQLSSLEKDHIKHGKQIPGRGRKAQVFPVHRWKVIDTSELCIQRVGKRGEWQVFNAPKHITPEQVAAVQKIYDDMKEAHAKEVENGYETSADPTPSMEHLSALIELMQGRAPKAKSSEGTRTSLGKLLSGVLGSNDENTGEPENPRTPVLSHQPAKPVQNTKTEAPTKPAYRPLADMTPPEKEAEYDENDTAILALATRINELERKIADAETMLSTQTPVLTEKATILGKMNGASRAWKEENGLDTDAKRIAFRQSHTELSTALRLLKESLPELRKTLSAQQTLRAALQERNESLLANLE